MLDDFFTRAVLAGIGIAIMTGPMGCLVVWRRMAYFGDTLAHSALLGVALGLLFQVDTLISVFVLSLVVSLLLLLLQRNKTLPPDALLGMLSHGSLALGLVTLSLMRWIRFDIQALLFGDILSVSKIDIFTIYAFAIFFLCILAWGWHRLFAATVNQELAEAEDMNPALANLVFMLLLAMIIAISMKIVGILLITALLIIPAITARSLASSPEQMAIIAAICGILAVVFGLGGSLQLDTPSGPSIIVAALVLFVISLLPLTRIRIGESREP